jgi:hypothetical protein
MKLYTSNKKNNWLSRGFIFLYLMALSAGIFSISGIKRINNKFHQLFVLNLVPALDISRAIELKYQNRVYLEEYLTGLSGENVSIVEKRIARNNKAIDTIIDRYVTSSNILQPDEEADLKNFLKAHEKYRRSEAKVIALTKVGKINEAEILFKSENYKLFQDCIKPMERFEEDDMKHSQFLYQEVSTLTQTMIMMLYVMLAGATLIAVLVGIGISRVYMER